MSMLEERIKRSGKKTPASTAPTPKQGEEKALPAHPNASLLQKPSNRAQPPVKLRYATFPSICTENTLFVSRTVFASPSFFSLMFSTTLFDCSFDIEIFSQKDESFQWVNLSNTGTDIISNVLLFLSALMFSSPLPVRSV